MYRIIGERSSGKTRKLLEIAKENNGIVVCSNPEAMKTKAYNYDIIGLDIISYGEFVHHFYTNLANRPIYVDELEKLFTYSNLDIDGYTLSEDD